MPNELNDDTELHVPGDGSRVIAIPSDRAWIDPRLIAAVCELTISDVTMDGIGSVPLATADPGRIAIGFSCPAVCTVGPWSDLSVIPFEQLPGNSTRFYSLRDYLNTVQLNWFGFAGAGTVIRVIEIRRN
jgi:hypothetical protein